MIIQNTGLFVIISTMLATLFFGKLDPNTMNTIIFVYAKKVVAVAAAGVVGVVSVVVRTVAIGDCTWSAKSEIVLH